MGDVVEIGKKKSDPHLSGEARCIACGHEWVAIAPTGGTELECPECRAMLGMFIWPTTPKSEMVWTCDCGCQLFYIVDTGNQCYRCGDVHRF